MIVPIASHCLNGMNFVFSFPVAYRLARCRLTPMKETQQMSANERRKLLKLAAAEFGRRGGKQTSEAKKAACKANAITRWAKVKAEKLSR